MHGVLGLAAAVVFTMASTAHAQVSSGSFAGELQVAPGQSLRLALHLVKPLEGEGLVGTLDSLDQGANGIALANVQLSGTSLRFTVPAVGGSYEGRWDASKKAWVGSWSQGGAGLPLEWIPQQAKIRPPLMAVKNWSMPSAASIAEQAVAGRASHVVGVGLVNAARTDVAVRAAPANTGGDKTRFEIGSITKIFTDLLLADMVSRGEVKLDQPVRELLPAEVLSDGANRPITLRDLATHYSGLPRLPANLAPTDPADPYANYDEARLYTFLKGWKADRAPGAMFEYSNLGVGLLGHALARRAGKPFEQLLTERVLAPLGMMDTDLSNRNLATPHGAGGATVKPWQLSVLAPAGGLRSTAADMTRFAAALLNPPEKLRPAVRLLIDHPLKPAGDFSKVGLGLLSVPASEGPLLNHDGGTGGMRSSLVLDPKRKRAAVVLSNSVEGIAPAALAFHAVAGVPLPREATEQPAR